MQLAIVYWNFITGTLILLVGVLINISILVLVASLVLSSIPGKAAIRCLKFSIYDVDMLMIYRYLDFLDGGVMT